MLCFEGVFEGVTTAEHRINDEKDEDAQPDSILSMPRVSFAFEDGCRMSGTGRMVDAIHGQAGYANKSYSDYYLFYLVSTYNLADRSAPWAQDTHSDVSDEMSTSHSLFVVRRHGSQRALRDAKSPP